MFRLSGSYSLRSLFVMVLLVSIGIVFLQNQYMTARFEVLETDVRVDGDGYLSGSLSFRCSQLNDLNNIEYADTILRIEHLSDTTMQDLVAGDEFFVSYLKRDLGPVKKENRYVNFMVSELGIDKHEIVGFVQLNGWAEVHIRGKAKPLP